MANFIIVDCPWHGLGAMIGSAASWLTDGVPNYVYMSNHFYTPRDGADPCNKWNWFFDQKLSDEPHQIHFGRNESIVPINSQLSPTTVHRLRNCIRQQWTVKPEIVEAARLYVPNPIKTLGIHYRGTDKVAEIPRPSTHLVAKVAIERMEELGLNDVLIATDDEEALLQLRARIPRPVRWFRGHIRGKTGMGIHQQFGSFRQAYETMIEIMAIGMTNHLVIGRSSVADAILLMAQTDNGWSYYN